MDQHLIQAVFLLHAHCSHDRFWIHLDSDQNKVITERVHALWQFLFLFFYPKQLVPKANLSQAVMCLPKFLSNDIWCRHMELLIPLTLLAKCIFVSCENLASMFYSISRFLEICFQESNVWFSLTSKLCNIWVSGSLCTKNCQGNVLCIQASCFI